MVLIVRDLDAHPMQGTLDVTHWTVYNIPAAANSIVENVAVGAVVNRAGLQGKNVRGVDGYQGPCPPPGASHHYAFDLYALDVKLRLAAGATRSDLLNAMEGHIVGKSTYIGIFRR
jgi:Raf kinase inhibitor-like YbhB/YbcL family protein